MSQLVEAPRLNSIFVKISAAIVLAVGVVIGTLSVLNWFTVSSLVETQIRSQAKSSTTSLARQVSGGIRFARADTVAGQLATLLADAEGAVLAVIAVSVDGVPVAAVSDTRATEEALTALALRAIASGAQTMSDDGHTVAVPAFFGDNNAIVGAVAAQWTPDRLLADVLVQKIRSLLVGGALFVIAVACVMLLLRRIVAQPLRQMQGVVSALSKKDYSIEVPAAGRNDEIGAIGKALEGLRALLKMGQAAELESMFKSAAFTGSSSSIMLTDDKMVVTYLNPRMTELFRHHADGIRLVRPDFDPDDIIGKSVDHFHRNNSEHIRAKMRAMGNSTFSTVVAFGDARISLSVTGIRDPDDRQVGYVLEWIDVTESRLNGAIIEAIDAAQIKAEFALDGRFISCNQQFKMSLGFSKDEMSGKSLQQVLTSSADKSKDGRDILEHAIQGSAHIGMLLFSTTTGAPAIVDGSLTCVKDYNGKPMRLLLLGKDVTKAQSELDTARFNQASAEREQSAVVEALRHGLKTLNSGDLTARIEQPFAGTYEDLRRDYNDMVQNLSNALLEIATNAENISNEARDISATADSLSRRTESTAATLEETAAALDSLTSSVKSTADGATKADQAVRDAKASAENSGQVVLQTVAAMDQIAASSDRITSIIKVIDDIAFQTNLLALNAGVEAARAGDAGRGFAVVASEVRALAQRSSDAAREINDLIANSGTQVKRGVDLVGKTGDALRQIVSSVTEISALVSDIAATSRQQSANLVEINGAVNQLDQSTQQNAARLEETTAASEGLTKDAVSLVEIVSHFKVDRMSKEELAVIDQKFEKDLAAKPHRAATPIRGSRVGAAVARPVESEGWEDF